MNNEIPAIRKCLRDAKQVIITTHLSPDGDAIGSSLGLHHFLAQEGIPSKVIVPNAFPKFLQWLKGSDEICVFEEDKERAQQLFESADVVFCLDYNETKRTGPMQEDIDKSAACKVLIDHHIGNPTWPDINLSVVGASSTCELVYDFAEAYSNGELLLNQDLAYALYTGLLTDTGNFQFSATTPKVHMQAARLIEAGVQPDLVHNHINNSFDELRLQFFGFCVSERMKILKDRGIAYMALSREDIQQFNIQTGGTEGLVNEPMKIANIDVSILLKEDEGKVKLSFRSKRDIDISVFAREFFQGGGHRNAAGGVSFASLEETERELVERLNNFNIS